MSHDAVRYGIGDLAALGGVSRRTVRYYVQEGLLPPPLGLGRGDHYGPTHLERLRHVKALQEAGYTLDDIRRDIQHDGASRPTMMRPEAGALSAPRGLLPQSVWHRVVVAPGVELHVDSTRALPPPPALRELADWCQRHLGVTPPRPAEEDD